MTMWWKHLRRLAEFCDGRLTEVEAGRMKRHLEDCARCRASVDEFRFAAGMVRQLAVVQAPESTWHSIEERVWGAIPQASTERFRRPSDSTWRIGSHLGRVPAFGGLGLATAALVAIVALGASYWFATRETGAGWQVGRQNGSVARLAVGEAIETDAVSRLRLTVGDIGTVDVEPNTSIQLLSASPLEQRLILNRGEITATISAPPRLFFVNTPSSTVVDLGCQYTMRVNEGGFGNLRVTAGWASLEWSGRESLVPAGASCETRPQVGPGTPAFDDASFPLREALKAFDFENGGARSLNIVLAESRVRDTLTLWHLLSRVEGADRLRVYDRMVALTPLPSGVTRDQALQLDPATLRRWREELAWTW
jgi:hypothetical protein